MVRQLAPEELKQRLDRGEPLVLLDVRQPWEHDLAALPGSLLIPLPELAERLDEIPSTPGRDVVVYCHHGIRSLSAAFILEQAGIAAVSLAGGIDLWSQRIDSSIPRY